MTDAPRRGNRTRRPRGLALDGWLIIDKPAGMTSTQVVNQARRGLDARKAGHGGTLDPLATGVLPIAFGAATKTVPYVQDGTKLYRFTLKLGEARDTDDADGVVVAASAARPTDAALREALPRLVGDIMQVPPAYSAIKVAGERAYDMAREGRAPTLEARPARVDRFELIERIDDDTVVFEVQSGRGVYMRSLARDLAAACGALGHVAALRRLRVGPFRIADAVLLEGCSAGALRPVSTAVADVAALVVSAAEAGLLAHGRALSLAGRAEMVPEGGLVRAMMGERVVAMCRMEDAELRPERLF